MLPVPPNVPEIVTSCPTLNGAEEALQPNCPTVPVIVTPDRVIVAAVLIAVVKLGSLYNENELELSTLA